MSYVSGRKCIEADICIIMCPERKKINSHSTTETAIPHLQRKQHTDLFKKGSSGPKERRRPFEEVFAWCSGETAASLWLRGNGYLNSGRRESGVGLGRGKRQKRMRKRGRRTKRERKN